MGTLYVVATPIGNLGDLSVRAADVLRSVPLVAAEDTRVTRKLLTHIGAHPRLLSYHAHSRGSRLDALLAELESADMALVTDAGTPGLSDPGAELVQAAADAGHNVVSVPGPSAISTALSVSGFPADRFLFLGFLPKTRKARRATLQDARQEPGTLVCFETPHRINAALEDISATLGDRRLAVCRELTKLHEEIFRGTAEEASQHFQQPRGEFVIVIQGAPEQATGPADSDIAQAISDLEQGGLTGRNLVDEVTAKTGAARSRVYRMVLESSRHGANGPAD